MLSKERKFASMATVFVLLLAACGGGGDDWFSSSWGPGEVQVVDVDGDGRTDVVTLAQSIAGAHREGHIAIRRQTAPGVFASPQRYVVGVSPRKLVVADIDGDRAPDLVMGEAATDGAGPGAVWLLKQNPASRGAFLPPQRLIRTASAPNGIAVGDINGDGAADLVFTSQEPGARGATLLAQNPVRRGSFLDPVALSLPGPAIAVAIANLDADGRLDIVFRIDISTPDAVDSSALGVLYQQADGALSAWIELPSEQTKVHSALLAVIDLNRDDTPDIVEFLAAGRIDEDSRITALLQGASRGSFTTVDSTLPDVQGVAAATGDLDGDRRPDFAIVGPDLDIALQDNAGAFESRTTLRMPDDASAVAIGDVNGDGRNDLIVLVDGHRVYLLLQSTTVPGTFTAPRFVD